MVKKQPPDIGKKLAIAVASSPWMRTVADQSRAEVALSKQAKPKETPLWLRLLSIEERHKLNEREEQRMPFPADQWPTIFEKVKRGQPGIQRDDIILAAKVGIERAGYLPVTYKETLAAYHDCYGRTKGRPKK
jgi:hypothetical protein